ncbi:hypothetical protein LC2W_3114 [Lacticaseibacillus paracasei]|nr:hypothetical protein LC2W_3114 [Lacticaseibacillus paracasei]AEA58621.1 hypothetical protein LCBD_3132 [Lacticaseibacillus paracasei]
MTSINKNAIWRKSVLILTGLKLLQIAGIRILIHQNGQFCDKCDVEF